MTADLAAANARYVLTVPQSVFESKPEVLKIIEAAERDDPAPGPYRIHRMPIWNPLGWLSTRSKDRIFELVTWEHDTMQPKYGINHGVEYTHTLGVAELYDYEWYFNGFPRTVRDPAVANSLGVELGKEVVYFPRRSYDMWNTRYFIVPYWHGGWRDEYRGFASFIFETKRTLPGRGSVPGGQWGRGPWNTSGRQTAISGFCATCKNTPAPGSFTMRGGPSPSPAFRRASRSETFQEILYAGDPLWNDPTQRVYDPHSLAWVSSDDMAALQPIPFGSETEVVRGGEGELSRSAARRARGHS